MDLKHRIGLLGKSLIIQNRRITGSKCIRIENFVRRFPLVGCWNKVGRPMFVRVCVCVSVSKHFRLWSPNGWSDRDGRIFVRCSGKTMVPVAERSVARGTCHVQSCKKCKNYVRNAAGQTNGRIRLKLGGLIATMGGYLLWGWRATVAPPSHGWEARETFHKFCQGIYGYARACQGIYGCETEPRIYWLNSHDLDGFKYLLMIMK